ncbi:hypothetical protein AQUCO_01000741v1 [Aquilegia coerulea]|uniref:ATP-dependent DNA helicase n=1 Tax=Aquilegia coerulea TaxID=218851 RepID=A0A2G5EBD3_AQUCA|nr:hypothetical protein AQUCO_01000741v1 [Aquilegia coerulea]
MNAEQLHAYTEVTNSVLNDSGKIFFLNGPAGTGKTFVYNTIADSLRSKGHIVIMVASSGIASLLLTGGRTAHSTFKIPLNVLDDSVCDIGKKSFKAKLFKRANLIVWDEVPMQHRYCVEAVDRSLQDILGNNKRFGGITVVLGGDFKQTLPVIPKGMRPQIVCTSLIRSHLWQHIERLTLVKNMSLNCDDIENLQFGNYLIKEYLAADKAIEDDERPEDRGNRIANENMHALDPPSLPPLKLQLKEGCPIMLLRNIQPRDGLCNGTCLKVIQFGTRVIEARILTGSHVNDRVFIPRITLEPSDSETPFKMSRRQFPVRLAFAMTINKSQGQSVKFVGIDLQNPVFSHGQLYVAMSRCTSMRRITILLPSENEEKTSNVVYPEVLL